MKKIFTSLLLIGGFFMFATTSVQAQDQIRNNTNCTFEIAVVWGKLTTCGYGGYETITVPPYTQVTVPNVSPYDMLYAKGYPTGTSPGSACTFYIAQGCAPYPPSYTAPDYCCDGYTASFITGFGIYITN